MRFAPPHWIRANHTSRMPRRWIYLDTEAREQLVGDRRLQSWRLGVTAFDRTDTNTPRDAETEWRDWTDPGELWAYVDSKAKTKARTVVVAHNLGYDLRISRALFELPTLGWSIRSLGVSSRGLTITWTRESRTLVMVDSSQWWPFSLAEVGRLVGIPKVELPVTEDGDDVWLARCRRDVEILRTAWRETLAWIERDDLGNWQRTGASMAWANWRHRHYTHRVLVHAEPEARAAEAAAIWTGRAEAWRWGRLSGRQWSEWDLPLAYPRIAETCYVPAELRGRVNQPTARWLERLPVTTRALVRATVTTSVPVLPATAPDAIVWPVGTFSGWWWDCEIALALAHADAVELHEAWTYRGRLALRQWAQWVIAVAEGSGPDYTPLQRATVKHWARALIGRFGAKYPLWSDYGQAPEPGVALSVLYDSATGDVGRMLTLGTRAHVSTDESYVADAAPAVMGAIMAECRVRLWQLTEIAGAEHVAYMDTDSLIVDRIGAERLGRWVDGGAGWGLRRKQRWTSLEVLGPRQLVVNGRGRIAGVPTRAKRAEGNVWRGELWDGVASTLASRTPDVVVIRGATWHVRGLDRRREHLEGGLTAPRLLGDPGAYTGQQGRASA